MGEYTLSRVARDAALADARAVRRAVFVEEQGVPEAVEMDGNDRDAVHVVAYDSETPVGTARLRFVGDAVGKAERVAVLPDHRERGLGTRLMNRVEAVATRRGCRRIVLHAQTAVEPFYRDLGYETVSDEFEEAGIPHVEMRKRLGGE